MWREQEKNEVEEAKEADIKRPSFLAPDEEGKAIFWPTPCLTMSDILEVHKGQSVVFWPTHVWQGYILTYTMAIGIILAADKEHSTILYVLQVWQRQECNTTFWPTPCFTVLYFNLVQIWQRKTLTVLNSQRRWPYRYLLHLWHITIAQDHHPKKTYMLQKTHLPWQLTYMCEGHN